VLGVSNGSSLPSGITLSFQGDLIAILQGAFVGDPINNIRQELNNNVFDIA
jgi:hypothetical protein